MKIRSGSVALLCLALVVTAGLAVVTTHAKQQPSDVVAHEWGTFTSIAGQTGAAVPWRPLSGPSDLPCFVTRLNPTSIKVLSSSDPLAGIQATVRMETPVIYFYSPTEQTVRVAVKFPKGMITEWFPKAIVPSDLALFDISQVTGRILWPAVRITPDATGPFLRERAESHYYPARETDASPVMVDGVREKFLFYRGLASFSVPINATVDDVGRVTAKNVGPHPVPQVILFQNIGGRMGFRAAGALESTLTIDLPPLTADFGSLRAELERLLVAEGLYAREAAAMVETWRDSWFEEGTRLFYIVPRQSVDAILPLTIDPAPREVARAFVGRIEILTPAVLDEVEQAILSNDLLKLMRCGRLLQAIVDRIASRPSLVGRGEQIQNMMRLVAASYATEANCTR